jgi:molybdenum cofactor cytidylyltransferase
MMQPIGVLLAAGRGRRLGGGKQFYLWPTAEGEKPLVAAAFDAIAPVCRSMIVVLGHRVDEVAAALGEREFQPVQSDPDAPMFASVRKGLQAALELDPEAAVLLQPGDHPEVSRETLERLLAAASSASDQAVIPEFGDQGGHPALIPASVTRQLLAVECPQGLGQYWTNHPQLCLRLPVNDESVVRDVDTSRDGSV